MGDICQILSSLRDCNLLSKAMFTLNTQARSQNTILAKHQCQHTLFPSTHTRIQAQCPCLGTWS